MERVRRVSADMFAGRRRSIVPANRNYRNDGTVIHCEWYRSALVDAGDQLMSVLSMVLDVTERQRAEEALHRSTEELARSNAELSQFAYVASHDLREPLRMVAAYTELLRKRYQGRLDDDADQFIGFAVDGAKRMDALLRALLTFSQVGSIGSAPSAPVDCETVLKRVLFNLEGSVGDSGAVITASQLPALAVHEVHLIQLLQNLLSNAIRYRGAAPLQIEISAERQGVFWLLRYATMASALSRSIISRFSACSGASTAVRSPEPASGSRCARRSSSVTAAQSGSSPPRDRAPLSASPHNADHHEHPESNSNRYTNG